ncbi:MAG: type II secretion system protein [Candidatus Saccharimonadales bacterium]
MLKKIRSSEHGFTFIEILIMLVLVGVLIAIVVFDYSGARARSRNDTRTAAVKTLRDYVEIFYSQNTYYPSLSDMNNPSWLAANLKSVHQSMYKDPSWTSSNKDCTKDGEPILISKSQTGCYGYDPTNSGISCASDDTTCSDYTLTATLEDRQGVYTLRQLD